MSEYWFWGKAYPQVKLYTSAGALVRSFTIQPVHGTDGNALMGLEPSFEPVALSEFAGSGHKDRFGQRYAGFQARFRLTVVTRKYETEMLAADMARLYGWRGKVRFYFHPGECYRTLRASPGLFDFWWVKVKPLCDPRYGKCMGDADGFGSQTWTVELEAVDLDDNIPSYQTAQPLSVGAYTTQQLTPAADGGNDYLVCLT